MEEISYEELGTIELLKEVEKGDLVALNQLGRRYEIGDRIEQDSKKALEAFDKVYKETDDEYLKYLAGSTIGEIYMTDENLKDEKLAEKYLKEASSFGDPFARYQYGRYLLGDDFNSNRTDEQYREAANIFLDLFECFKDEEPKAAGESAYTLSYIYANGKGVEKDLYKAKEYAEYAFNCMKSDDSQQLLNAINEEIKTSKISSIEIEQSDKVIQENWLTEMTAINFSYGSTLEELMKIILASMQEKNIPCGAKYVQIKTGNIFNSSIENACMLYHPEHREDYFNYVFVFKQQGNMGRLYIYRGGVSTQYSKEQFNQKMKGVSGTGVIGLLAKTGSLAARGINAIGKDKGKLQDEQLYYSSFEQNIVDTFQIRNN